jgi:hypothetical protein
MIKKISKLLFLILILACTNLCLAQPPDGGGNEQDPDAGIPIDGGASYLAAAGIAYGIRKIYNRNKKRNNAPE